MCDKADVIDDVTKQIGLIAFFRWFFSVSPTQMASYDQKFGMKMITRTEFGPIRPSVDHFIPF